MRERETAGMAVRKIVKEGFWPRRYPHTIHATPSKRQKTETFVEHSNTILFSEENRAKHLLCPHPPSLSLSLSFSRSRGTKGDKVSARYEYEGGDVSRSSRRLTYPLAVLSRSYI